MSKVPRVLISPNAAILANFRFADSSRIEAPIAKLVRLCFFSFVFFFRLLLPRPSWVGACPGDEESAGVNYSHRSPKGNRHMRRLLNQAANAAARTKGSIFEIVYRRSVPRLGHNQAIRAIAHRQCRLIWLILHQAVRYEEPGPAVTKQSKQKRTKRMIRHLRLSDRSTESSTQPSTGAVIFEPALSEARGLQPPLPTRLWRDNTGEWGPFFTLFSPSLLNQQRCENQLFGKDALSALSSTRRASAKAFLFLWWAALACGEKAPSLASNAGDGSSKSPIIVIGFVGGFVRHDDPVHSGVQLGARIRSAYHEGVYAEVFENRRREQAHEKIVKLLDANHDGILSEEEKRNARIIIYGMSWGGSETVELARELDREKIPVLLTIQVDSVAKRGENDRLIPSNVDEAVNFYQTDGLLHGQTKIRAEDASRTRILGNFRMEYAAKPLSCADYPWYDRVFTKPHTEIECDPTVWERVESLVRSKLPPAAENQAAHDRSH